MPKITYIQHSGEQRQIDVPIGWSVMEGAVRNGLQGIDAECGGACACATCHVHVDPAWLAKLQPKEAPEESMLEFAQDPAADSRLSCQVKVTAELDGLIVRMPESQR